MEAEAGERLADDLPESLQEIAEVIGLDQTLVLVRRFGGCRIYIPASVDGHSLVDVLGKDGAHALASIYGGEHVEIPRAIKAVRDRAIRARFYGTDGTDGEGYQDLALAYMLTERQVRRIIKG